MTNFLGEIATGLRCALEPLQDAFSNELRVRQFFADFGWDVNVAPGSVALLRAGFALDATFDAAKAVADQLEDGAGDTTALARALVEAVVRMIDAIKALATAPPGGLPFPFDQPAFWSEIPPALADYLLLRLLESQVPALHGVLRLVGLATLTHEAPAGAGRVPYLKRAIRWDRIPRLVSDPVGLFKEIYRWDVAGQPLDHPALLEALQDFFHGVRFPARLHAPGPLAARYYDPANPAFAAVRQLSVPVFMTASADWSSFAEVGVAVLPIPPKGSPAQAPVGIVIAPLASGSLSGATGEPGTGFSIALRGGFHDDGVFGAEIRPSGVELFAVPGSMTVDAELVFSARPEAPWRLLGDPDSFRLEVGGFTAGIGIRGQLTSPEVLVSAGTGRGASPPKLAVVLQTSSADGFLGSLIGSNPIRIELGGTIVWSSQTGLHFDGGGGFQVAFPLHLNLGIAEISVLSIGVNGSPRGLAFEAGVTGKAMLGPLTAVVEEFGFRATLDFSGADGKLGPVDVGFGFKPPKGVGLSVDAGVVKGGGYLYFDFEKEEYAGALELVFSGFVALKAIGLVTTRMPDGSRGFSLLIIITAEFGTGIQLGFGFTLLGVGGLIGLNRTVLLEPLAEGVRTGAVNRILFPENVVENAPRIISDLRAIFPVQQDRFLIGPMAKLGWGTPTLVSLSLGIIIEIPGNIAILGVLRLALPTSEAALLVLQVAFVGAIEFDKKRVFFFASLFESRILFITIEGEMGLLAAFGDDANFVLSVGGFHPRFTPPPLPFPSPRRIALSILNESWGRIRVEAYFAVTSNSVQFGARAELFFGFSALSLEGHLGFDALIRFSPFYFIVEIGASVSLKVFGVGLFSIRLEFALEGTSPWRAHGRGSLSILFFEISADFDVTWGEPRDTTLPASPVMPILKGELDKLENWRAALPAGSSLLVSLRKLDPASDALVLHPVGTLRVSQRAVPLDISIDKVGSQKPSDARRFSLGVTGGGFTKKGDVLEKFAPAQFQDMSDADKLSRPAYVDDHGGVELSPGAELAAARMVKRVVRYREIVVDTNFKRFVRPFILLAPGVFAHFLRGNAAAQSALSRQRKKQVQPFDAKVTTRSEAFAVALSQDNTAHSAAAASFSSETLAREHLNALIAGDPSLADSLHVIPRHELSAP
ncbi:DUF6603 domain-containing protein [Sorangium sp. So ce233]|uniref:DUF6603 domain-containing protein n=1 Tax=Sorangium sp. So ce233 TaxID=3133290 RepID=UPI003F5F667C